MNVVTSTMKLASLFRGWGRRAESPAAVEPPSPVIPAAPVEAPPPPPPPPAPVPVAPPPTQLTNEVEMPLQTILEKLPQDLRAKMTVRIEELGNASIAIPTEQVLPQLALGSVKIMFGQLRTAAPELFRVAEEYDSLPVILPLNVLLARINPVLLPRNPQQKQAQVPQDIRGPFGAKAEGVTFATTMLKAPAPAATAPQRMGAKPESDTKIKMRTVGPAQPAFTRTAPAPSIAPPPPATPVPITPTAPVPATREMPASRPIPFPSPSSPAVSSAPAVSTPPAPPKPVAPPAPAPMATPVETAPVVSHAPAVANATAVPVLLSDVCEKWPEPLRAEISQQNLANVQAQLPMNLLEPALKRGRVVFSWQNLRSWMSPRPGGASPNDGIELELPLKVIVPSFLERHPPTRPPLRVSVDRSIPNLFFGFPSAEMEAPVAAPIGEAPPPAPAQIVRPQPTAPSLRTVAPIPPPAPVQQPVTPVQPQPVPVMQPAQASDTNYYVASETLKAPAVDQSVYNRSVMTDTEIKKRIATPKEIVERAMQIAGVAGAVITLPDGLKVAAQVPADMNPDTVAAFIPQIFERVGQSTRELRMGALNNLRFTVGNVPWKIFRINAIYFAAFGRAGERLPTPQLAQLAAELDRKTK